MTETNRHAVAIVDDDDGARDSLRFLLEVIGHTVEIIRIGSRVPEGGPTTYCLPDPGSSHAGDDRSGVG